MSNSNLGPTQLERLTWHVEVLAAIVLESQEDDVYEQVLTNMAQEVRKIREELLAERTF